MAKFIIRGPNKLSGEVDISGNKNSTFPLIAASLLTNEPTKLTNMPAIKDVEVLVKILEELGCKIDWNKKTRVMLLNPKNLHNWKINSELGTKLRGGFVIAASLLFRFGIAEFPRPGGDAIGQRPVEAHLSALKEFGVKVSNEKFGTRLKVTKLKPANVLLEEPSPTATEMVLIVASCISGKTIIEDAASEPHVNDLAEMLVKMGAKIDGIGTNKLIIEGNEKLLGIEHKVCPDHIEAGTFAIAAAITNSKIKIRNVEKKDLRKILLYLGRMGVKFEFEKSDILIIEPSQLKSSGMRAFKTRPWPGFPTDLMSMFIVLATQTSGTVLCHDWMYESRMFFVDRLIRMGANIILADPHRVIVNGPEKLNCDLIPTADIRAGGAMVLAALVADGESTIEHAEVIDRGYENFDEKLRQLGAKIERVEQDN